MSKIRTYAPMAKYLILKDGRFVKDPIMPELFTQSNALSIAEAERAFAAWEANENFKLTECWIDVFETNDDGESSIVETIKYCKKWVPENGQN